MLAECSNGGWKYVFGNNGSVNSQQQTPEEQEDFVGQCLADGKAFVGGGQGITELAQMAGGTLFVAGDFQKKVAGEIACDLDVRGSRCDNLEPSIADAAAVSLQRVTGRRLGSKAVQTRSSQIRTTARTTLSIGHMALKVAGGTMLFRQRPVRGLKVGTSTG